MSSFQNVFLVVVLLNGLPPLFAQVTTVLPSDDRIQYFGRWDFSTNPDRPTATWGAVYIKVKFHGTGIKINLHDPKGYFQYQVDEGPMVQITAGSKINDLGQDYSDEDHVLVFYRRTNGNVSVTQFRGFEITGEILDPDPRPCLAFEFVGNSITMGFGNEGNGGATAANTNGYMSWGPQLARLFNAEWSVIAHSGQGMYQNMVYIEGAKTMSDEYLDTHFPAAPISSEPGWNSPREDWDHPNHLWDFSSWVPDVHFCALGTNDFLGNVPPYEEYTARYHRYLDSVRSYYPEALIVLFGICLETYDLPNHRYDYGNIYLDSIVSQRIREYGDHNIMWVNPRPDYNDASMWLQPDPPGQQINYIGDKTHPTVLGNRIIAQRMYEILEPIIGKEHCGKADCHGDYNGKAYMNDCQTCVGGNTGLGDDDCVTNTIDDAQELIQVFPNPTTSSVFLSKTSQWTLLNTQGAVLKHGTGNTIDMSLYTTGMYIVYISGNEYKVYLE